MLETKLNALLTAAQDVMNAIHKKTAKAADVDASIKAMLEKVRVIRDLKIESPVAETFCQRVKELMELRGWKELDL